MLKMVKITIFFLIAFDIKVMMSDFIENHFLMLLCRPQNNYTSTVFINLKIFVDIDGTLTLNKHGYQFYSIIDLFV